MRLLLIATTICLLIAKNSIGQEKDTFQFPQSEAESEFKGSGWGANFNGILKNKIISGTRNYNFPATLFISDASFKKYYKENTFKIPILISFESITFSDSNKTNFRDFRYNLSDSIYPLIDPDSRNNTYLELENGISIEDCSTSSTLEISNIKSPNADIRYSNNTISDFSLTHSIIKGFNASENKSRMINFTDCEIESILLYKDTITSIDKNVLSILNKYSSDTITDKTDFITINFEKTRIDELSINNVKSNNITINFIESTINKNLTFTDKIFDFNFDDEEISYENILGQITDRLKIDTVKTKYGSLHFELSNSTINAQLNSYNETRNQVYNFTNCRFGENIDFSNLAFDTISFVNCTKFQSDIYLSIPLKKDVFVAFKNSDLSKIHFDYSSNVHFLNNYWTGESFDETNKDYNALLDKFRREGKENSFRNLEIEYKQWKYNQGGWWGEFLNLVDRWWWYYGYRKQYILYWSLALLLLFGILNFRSWRYFKEVYPVISDAHPTYYEKLKSNNQLFTRTLHVIVVTFFIFFSIRIEFNKLNYNNNRMLILFFLQYVIGLICLFFIINFILKI